MILKQEEKQAKAPRKLGWVYPFLVVGISVFVVGLAFSPRPDFLYTARIELSSATLVEDANQAADRWINADTVIQAAEATRIVDADELRNPTTIEALRQAVRIHVTDVDHQMILVQFKHHNRQVATDFLDHLGVIAVANASPGLAAELQTQEISSNTVEGVFGEGNEEPTTDLAIKRGAFIAARTGTVSRFWLKKVAMAGLIAGAFATVLLRFESNSVSLMDEQSIASITGVPVIGSVFPSRTKPKAKSAAIPNIARRFVFFGELTLAIFIVFVTYNLVVDNSFFNNFVSEPFSTVVAACDQHLRGIPVVGALK